MPTSRQQTIVDKIYAERQENEAARMHMRKTGDTSRLVASDRRLGRLADDLNMAGSNIDTSWRE